MKPSTTHIIDALPYFLFELDLDGNIKLLNETAASALGKRASEFIGKNFFTLVKDNPQKYAAMLDNPKEYYSKAALGNIKISLRYTPIKNPSGSLKSVVVVGETLKQEDLLNSYMQLQEESKTRDELFNITSHELRTPLIPLINYVGLLKKDSASLNEKQKQALNFIEKNSNRLKHIIEQILEMARLKAKKLNFSIAQVSVKDMVHDAIAQIEDAAAQKKIKIAATVQQRLPKMFVDKKRITQVLSYLLDNAIKFSDKGKVTLTAKKDEGYIAFDVKDMGKGIPKSYQTKIFQSFSQEESSITRKTGGLGLGLKISKQIVELHGGTLELVSSTPGKGSLFRVKIPIKRI